MAYAEIVEVIRKLAERVQENEERIGVLSTGEFIAVAMVLDRKDLLDHYTMLEAAHRLGDEWLAAAIEVQRNASKIDGKWVFR